HQHHGFGEGLAVADDLENLFLSIGRQPIDLDGSGDDEIERMRRFALVEQVVPLVQVEKLAGIHQLVHLLVVQGFEQVVAAKDLVMYAMKHHARRPVFSELKGVKGTSGKEGGAVRHRASRAVAKLSALPLLRETQAQDAHLEQYTAFSAVCALRWLPLVPMFKALPARRAPGQR